MYVPSTVVGFGATAGEKNIVFSWNPQSHGERVNKPDKQGKYVTWLMNVPWRKNEPGEGKRGC